jgi:hypothetical protein
MGKLDRRKAKKIFDLRPTDRPHNEEEGAGKEVVL